MVREVSKHSLSCTVFRMHCCFGREYSIVFYAISASVWILVSLLVVFVVFSVWEVSPTPVSRRVLGAFGRAIDQVKERSHVVSARVQRGPLDNPC